MFLKTRIDKWGEFLNEIATVPTTRGNKVVPLRRDMDRVEKEVRALRNAEVSLQAEAHRIDNEFAAKEQVISGQRAALEQEFAAKLDILDKEFAAIKAAFDASLSENAEQQAEIANRVRVLLECAAEWTRGLGGIKVEVVG